MRVSQINSTTNFVLPKRTLGQRVLGLAERVRCRFDSKYALAVMERNMQEVKALYLQAHPEIVARSNAAKKFIQDNHFASPKLNDDTVYCLSAESGALLKTCGDDVEKIYNLMGAYGLLLYGSVGLSNEDVLKKSADYKVSENAYLSDKKLKLTFDEYLDANDRGYVSDIYKRFGQCGKTLFDRYLMTGTVRNGINSKVEETYSTTPQFDLLVRDISLPNDQYDYITNSLNKIV